MTIDLKPKAVYSFDVYPSAILPSSFKNVVILGNITEELARKSIGTAEMHAQVYPYLPAGTPDDPAAYDYVQIKTATGEITTLGIPWIKEESVVLVDSRTITVKIGNQTAADVPTIRNLLVQAGYNSIDISIS